MKQIILYFDDEKVLLDIFRELFNDDYDVRTASSLEETRRVLSECSPDFIISDLSMPEISGIEFLREASRKYPHSIRILITGFGELFQEEIDKADRRLINYFIPKPWREPELRSVLERGWELIQARGEQP